MLQRLFLISAKGNVVTAYDEIIAEVFLPNPRFLRILKVDFEKKRKCEVLIGTHLASMRATCKLFRTNTNTLYFEAVITILENELGYKSFAGRLFGVFEAFMLISQQLD